MRLADYGLGHDERARRLQPIASRLSPASTTDDLPGTRRHPGANATCTLATFSAHTTTPGVLADVIERRATDGENYLDLLTDPFARELAGEDGYVTVLLEVRARNLLDETAWWTISAPAAIWRPTPAANPRRVPHPLIP